MVIGPVVVVVLLLLVVVIVEDGKVGIVVVGEKEYDTVTNDKKGSNIFFINLDCYWRYKQYGTNRRRVRTSIYEYDKINCNPSFSHSYRRFQFIVLQEGVGIIAGIRIDVIVIYS